MVNNGSSTLQTVCMIAVQCLERLKFVHEKSLVHRDLKPQNLVIGRKSHLKRKIYLIDFGLACYYRSTKTGKYFDYRDRGPALGTLRFMSRKAHRGATQSPRDDLESLGYLLVYFLKGKLPWMNVIAETVKQRFNIVEDLKINTSVKDLCTNLPDEFGKYLEYARKLGYYEDPDYDYMRSLFKNLMKRSGFKNDCGFDWEDENLYSVANVAPSGSALSDIKSNEVENRKCFMKSCRLFRRRKDQELPPSIETLIETSEDESNQK
ncbi:hypothetical protein ACOME3_000345 [Neoechinorhynchus agilis]